MGTSGPPPSTTLADTLDVFHRLDEPGTPLTSTEVAEEVECTRRTVYGKLEALAEQGELKSKKTGARSRIWWRPTTATDASERANSQQTTSEQFSAFVRAVQEYAIFTLDPNGTITSWNEGVEQIKGYEEDDILGEHISVFYTDDAIDRGVPEHNLEEAADRGQIEDEGWRVRKDGSRFWANVTITAVRDDDGTLQGFTKVTRDMTERKENERELKQYKTAVDVASDVFVTIDERSTIQAVNPAVEDIFGYDSDELVGEPLTTLMPESLREQHRDGIRRYLETGERNIDWNQIELPGQHKDGHEIPLAISFSEYEHGGDRFFVGVIRDDTERKTHERELETRIQQQQVVTDLGQRALENPDLDVLFDEAVEAVADTLDNAYCKVLDLLDDDELLLRAGVGWKEGYVGEAAVGTTLDSQAGHTLRSETPIVVEDLRTEERFSGPPLLTEHDVVSGISTIIGPYHEPWGVLGTHDTRQRELTEHDVNFVQSVANILASAIENERAQSELEEMYGRISDAFFALDEEWQFTYLNEHAHELINPEGRTLVGEHVWEEFPEAISRNFKPEYERAMYEQETVSFEEYYPEPLDIWVEVNAYPSKTGLSVYFRDITERKEMEQELRESEAKFRTLAENLEDIIWMTSPDPGEFLYVNPAYEAVWGRDRDSLYEEPLSFVEAIHSEDRERVREAYTALPDQEYDEAFRVVRPDGEVRWVHGRAVPVRDDGEVVRIVGIAEDITEQKERERALEESERRYRTLAEHFPNGAVGVYDHDLQYTLTEGAVLGNTLPGAEHLEGDRVPEIFPQETVADLEPLFRAAVEESETGSTTTEFGGRHWRVWATPLRDADGEIFAGLSFCQDVTEQVEHEQRLEELVDKLEESNEQLERFAYVASHDLQEPLRMVSSYLQLLERRYADELDEDAQEFIDFAVDGADRMQAMIEDLLDYSRLDTQGNEFEPTDCNAVLEQTLESLRRSIEDNDAEITSDTLPTVMADANQLGQLFQNLISNAIKYRGDEPPSIAIEVDRRGDKWQFSVTDNGIGIDPNQTERIFQIFNRLHSTDEYSGTGIGLAMCQKIVERHGGEIWVDSEPGDGSTFSFTLPVAQTTGDDESHTDHDG